jgi:CDGSH-type Zn-finger protein
MSEDRVLIVPYRDGPYLVRGPVVLRDQDGRAIETARRPVALCRCGKSRMRPFCDGTHRLVRFEAPSHAELPFGERQAISAPLPGRPIATGKLSNRRLHPDLGATSNGSGFARSGQPSAMAAPARLSAARDELGRAKERLACWLQTGSRSAREQFAMSSAEELIYAAWLLLGDTDRETEITRPATRGRRDVRSPCSCLVRGALEALEAVSSAASGDEELSRLLGELHAVLSLLAPETGLP